MRWKTGAQERIVPRSTIAQQNHGLREWLDASCVPPLWSFCRAKIWASQNASTAFLRFVFRGSPIFRNRYFVSTCDGQFKFGQSARRASSVVCLAVALDVLRCFLKPRFEPNPLLSDASITQGVCRIDCCVDCCEMRALPTFSMLVVYSSDIFSR
jgi:hypothetical protein